LQGGYFSELIQGQKVEQPTSQETEEEVLKGVDGGKNPTTLYQRKKPKTGDLGNSFV